MTERNGVNIIRRYRDGPPQSLAEYLDRPEAYPLVSAPYPSHQPFPPSGGEPLNLAAALAEAPDPLGPPMTMPGANDPRVRAMAFRNAGLPSAPPEQFTPPPQEPMHGLAPMSHPDARGDDLDAEWNAALSRAQRQIARETGFGMESPASRAARMGAPPGRPTARPPNALIAALQQSPFGEFVNQVGAPGIARRQAQARASIPPMRMARR